MAKSKSGVVIKQLTVAQRAYIAGIMDGEGYISISKRNDQTGMRYGYCFRPQVSICMTHEATIRWLHIATGLGAVCRKKPSNRRAREAFIWTLWSRQAYQLIKAIQPFLVTKAQHANLLIHFVGIRRDGVGRDGLTDEEWEVQHLLRDAMRLLNKRGIKHE